MVTAAAFEGGDFMIVAPGVAVIATARSGRRPPPGRWPAGWRRTGWEVRIERIPPHFVHIDVLACMLGEGLAAVCVDAVGGGFVRWLSGRGVQIVPVSPRRPSSSASTACAWARTACSRRPSPRTSTTGLRALGLTVYDPELGVHAGRRRRALPDAGAAPRTGGLMAVEPARAIADLRELDRLTGGPDGARRVCWTPEWQAARDFLRARLGEIEGVTVEVDEAANLWATLLGAERDGTVAVGSHLDSVPAGAGWMGRWA